MKELKNCPSNWFNTCRNSNLYCNKCGACNDSNEKVYYSPNAKGKEENYSVVSHPHTLKQRKEKNKPIVNKQKSKEVRAGFKQEYKTKDSLNELIKSSLKSGSVLGDGDLHALGGLLKIDSKLRMKKQSFNVSWNEYTTGLSQNINTWAITITKDNKDHTLICMTEELFAQLLASVSSNKD